jgi:hypothetical protein
MVSMGTGTQVLAPFKIKINIFILKSYTYFYHTKVSTIYFPLLRGGVNHIVIFHNISFNVICFIVVRYINIKFLCSKFKFWAVIKVLHKLYNGCI